MVGVAGIAAPAVMGKGALDIAAVAGREFCQLLIYGVICPRSSVFFRLQGDKKGIEHMVGWRT